MKKVLVIAGAVILVPFVIFFLIGVFSGDSTPEKPSGVVDTIQKSDLGRLDGTVSFTEPRLCNNPVDKTCSTDMRTFTVDTPEIWFSSKFSGIKEGQKITFVWQYISGELDIEKPYTIDSVEMIVKKEFTELNTNLSRPTSGWPVGEYKISVSVDGVNKDFLAQRFSVK